MIKSQYLNIYLYDDKTSYFIENIKQSIIKVECAIYCKATCKAIWLRYIIFEYKVVESTFRTLTLCCNNVVVMTFSQMIKVLLIQSVLILSVNLFEKRYVSISHRLYTCKSTKQRLKCEIVCKQMTRMSLAKSFDIQE